MNDRKRTIATLVMFFILTSLIACVPVSANMDTMFTSSFAPTSAIYVTTTEDTLTNAETSGDWNKVSDKWASEGMETVKTVKYIKYDISGLSALDIENATLDFAPGTGDNVNQFTAPAALYFYAWSTEGLTFNIDAVSCPDTWNDAKTFKSAYESGLPDVVTTIEQANYEKTTGNGQRTSLLSCDITEYIKDSVMAGKDAVYFKLSVDPIKAYDVAAYIKTQNIKLNVTQKTIAFSQKQITAPTSAVYVTSKDGAFVSASAVDDWDKVSDKWASEGMETVKTAKYIKYDISGLSALDIENATLDFAPGTGNNSNVFTDSAALYLNAWGSEGLTFNVDIVNCPVEWSDAETFKNAYESGLPNVVTTVKQESYAKTTGNGQKTSLLSCDIASYIRNAAIAGKDAVYFKLSVNPTKAYDTAAWIKTKNITLNVTQKITSVPNHIRNGNIISVKWRCCDGRDESFSVLPILIAKENSEIVSVDIGESLVLDGTEKIVTLNVDLTGITDFANTEILLYRWDSLGNREPLYGVTTLD